MTTEQQDEALRQFMTIKLLRLCPMRSAPASRLRKYSENECERKKGSGTEVRIRPGGVPRGMGTGAGEEPRLAE